MFVFANVFQPLIDFFEAILQFFHDTIGLGWGGAIIALTLLVRMALLPLTLKQFKSMQAMAHLQPEIKKLQERYKNDKERLNQEMMRFYRENKVNPFASCLPMVAQLPVFLALYYMLRVDLRYDICPAINPAGSPNPQQCGETPESSWFFIPDLTSRATGAVLVLLIILYVGTQVVSTLLMSATADRNQRMIFIALPFFFIAVIWRFPAGLLLYWITTNLWTILQQSIIKKRLGPLREQVAAAAKEAKEKEKAEKSGAAAAPAAKGKGGGGGRALGKLSPTAAVAAGESGSDAKGSATNGPPPAPPRKKKKRSGRRR